MRTLLLAALAMPVLAGCAGQYHFLSGTPLRDLLAAIEPGVATRDDVRARLGTPWYAAPAWHAELYAGTSEFQEAIAVGLPVPAGKSLDAATLLVVYDAEGTVRGIEYFGAGKDGTCPDGCRKGELQGLQVERLQILVAPVSSVVPAGRQPEPGHCQLVVDATGDGLDGARAAVYLDQKFLQRVPAAARGYFQLSVEPGEHSVACRTEGTNPEKLPLPGHTLPAEVGWPGAIERSSFRCDAGESRYFRLVNAGGRWVGPARCAPEPVDALTLPGDAREVIIP